MKIIVNLYKRRMNNMVKISASILSKRDLETINKLNQLDIDYFHIDVMDGEFVSNVTFSLD
ncbi:MAG: hypothetical protein WCX15_02610, partial [Bacilli bacterium]